MKAKTIALAGLATALLSACNLGLMDDGTYTLYRGNAMTGNLRIHVATFDSAESTGEVTQGKMSYNHTNCVRAAKLFQEQQMVAVGTRYWCEMGRYKK
jgi:hypothetical protein